MAGGASSAEAVVREGDEFSTTVRLGQVETLKESGSRAVGIRVFFGKRAASTYSSDFSRAGLDRMQGLPVLEELRRRDLATNAPIVPQ